MMKKLTFSIILMCIAQYVGACAFFVKNTTKYTAKVTDQNTGKIQLIEPGENKQIGTDPDVHAKFTISFGKIKNYRVHQTSCSKSHRIDITTDDVVNACRRETREKVNPEVLQLIQVDEK